MQRRKERTESESRLAASTKEGARLRAEELETRFTPVVVAVLTEFANALEWHGPGVEVEVFVPSHSKEASPTRSPGESEVVWRIPNPRSVRPNHVCDALVTVSLGLHDRYFTCYVPHGIIDGRHPKFGIGTPQAQAKLTAEGLATTITMLYRCRDDEFYPY
jgi:hypothetical protein